MPGHRLIVLAAAVPGVDQNWTRNTGEDGRPGSVFIIARRASDVITDLCMAGRLSREHHDDDEDSPFWTPDLPDDPEPGWPLTNPSTPEERYLAEAFRFDYIADMQEAILARTNASLITGLSMYLEWLAKDDLPEQLAAIFEKSQASSRGLLLSGPFTAARTAQGHRGSRGLRPADPGPT